MAIDFKPEQNDYTNLTPFKTWLIYQINTWGVNNFPFLENDFDQLTNYGMMMKLMKAMNDTIGNQNKVEDDMSKLYGAFTELQTYINNYFDNLDVQDEINNKLDEMAEDGILEQIIEQYLNSSAIWGFDNVDEMKQATNLINGSFARTLGYYEVNDGGGSLYKITDTESETEYQEELESGLYATLIIENDSININQFGAKGDNETDDGIPFQKALNFLSTNNIKKLILDKNKNYYVNKVLTIFKDSEIDLNKSTIRCGQGHIFINFKSTIFNWPISDTYTSYNGNGNITIKNGTITGGTISFIHGKNIKLENINFNNNNNEHYLEICACSNYKVLNCNFTGLVEAAEGRRNVEYIQIDVCDRTSFPWLPVGSPSYDGTINENITIDSCQFRPSETTEYNHLYCAIGSHVVPNGYHKNVLIKNNIIENCSYAGIYLIKVDGATIQNNRVINGTGNRGINVHSCKNAVITDNIINSVKGSISALTTDNINNENITIKNNSVILSNDANAYVVHETENVNFINNYGYANNLLIDFTNVLNIVCFGNTYNNSLDTFGNVIYYGGTNTIKLLDMFKAIQSSIDTTNHIITLNDDITRYNILEVNIGYEIDNNFQQIEVRAFTGSNFRLGEGYMLPYIDKDGTIKTCTLVIDSNDSKKISYTISGTTSIRNILGKAMKIR